MNKLQYRGWVYILFLFIVIPAMASLAVCQESGEVEANQLQLVSQFDVGGSYDVKEYQNYGYAATNEGICIIDLSNISEPEEISVINCDGGAFSFDIWNDVIYIAAAGYGLQIYNISDKDSPNMISSMEIGWGTAGVHIQGDLVVVANYESVASIYNCSNLAAPVLVSNFNEGGRACKVQIKDDVLYIANPDLGLQLVDISIIESPTFIRTVANTFGAWDIDIFQDRLYLGCHGNGLKILDISNPKIPLVEGSYLGGGEAQGVSGNRELLFLVDMGDDGVELLDVSDPGTVEKINSYKVGDGNVHDLYFNGTYAFIADLDQGFTILEYKPTKPESISISAFPLLYPFAFVSLLVIYLKKRTTHYH